MIAFSTTAARRIAREQFATAKAMASAAATATLHGRADPVATRDALRAVELAREQLHKVEG